MMNRYFIKAFTLIELLVVISIIGVLVALSLFGLQGARESARDARRKSDLEQIRSGLELYKADCNDYPTAAQFPAVGLALLGDNTPPITCSSMNTYISSRPGDPTPDRLYPYTPSGSPANSYTLCASLEQGGAPASGCGNCGGGYTCNYKVTNP